MTTITGTFALKQRDTSIIITDPTIMINKPLYDENGSTIGIIKKAKFENNRKESIVWEAELKEEQK